MVCSIFIQAQLDYAPAEKKEEEVCAALKMLRAMKSRASIPMSAGKQIMTH